MLQALRDSDWRDTALTACDAVQTISPFGRRPMNPEGLPRVRAEDHAPSQGKSSRRSRRIRRGSILTAGETSMASRQQVQDLLEGPILAHGDDADRAIVIAVVLRSQGIIKSLLEARTIQRPDAVGTSKISCPPWRSSCSCRCIQKANEWPPATGPDVKPAVVTASTGLRK